MPTVTEIASDVYRFSIYVPEFDLQFNHFLVKDEQPLLYHTGMRHMFPQLQELVRKVIDPKKIRWIGFSHFEVDECGAINEWLNVSPDAQPVCSLVGAMVNLNDFANRPPKGLAQDEQFSTGKYKFKFKSTPHLPHGWDAGSFFEETQKILFCSDLFHHVGEVEAITNSDIIDRTRKSLIEYQKGPLMDYMPYTSLTKKLIQSLADLKPKTLATMHGSSFNGDCVQALHVLGIVMKDVLGKER